MSRVKDKKATADAEMVFLDSHLRPADWKNYIGQKHIKDNLRILLAAAKERGHPAEHLLFYGPPGLGKTTLAYLVAKEIGGQIKPTSGPAIEKVGDLASLLTNLSAGDVLFIDEVHRLNKTIEEVLYPAMESGALHIIIGKGPSARTIELKLQPFTLIAATTKTALMSSPLRSRFSGGTFRLEFYSPDEIKEIIQRSAKILEADIADEAVTEIARRSRATPRIANHLLKRARDFAQVKRRPLDLETVRQALALLEIDELGLGPIERKILAAIIEKFSGGPVGLNTIAAASGEEASTLEEVHEPYLMQTGLLERTPRGRLVTPRAYEHLGHKFPKSREQTLL